MYIMGYSAPSYGSCWQSVDRYDLHVYYGLLWTVVRILLAICGIDMIYMYIMGYSAPSYGSCWQSVDRYDLHVYYGLLCTVVRILLAICGI